MPLTFPDRFWWLRRVWGVLGVLTSLGGIVELVIRIADIHNSFNLGTGWQFFIILLVIVVLSLIAAALGALPILGIHLVSLAYLRRASPARDRFHRRLLAIGGEENVIPLAEIEVDVAKAPKLQDSPLELLWRPTILYRISVAVTELICVPIFAFLSGLGVYLVYVLTTDPAQHSLLEQVRALLEAGAVVVVSLLLVVLLIFFLPRVFVPSYGVSADAEGILFRSPQTGRRSLLRWEEVRLFEVEQVENQRPGKYRLYGQNTFIQWLNQPPSKWVASDLSSEEIEQRHQALLNLIVARTDLLPRTFDKRLAEAEKDR